MEEDTYWRETEFVAELVNQLPAAIFWKNAESIFMGCNQTFAKLAGLESPREIIGKTDFDLPWGKTQGDLYRNDDLNIIYSKHGKQQIEENQTLADGSEIVLLTSKMPLLSQNGKVKGILGIYHDITDRKKMERSLAQSKNLAETANRAKSEFLRNMEHQLRTPFSGVYSLVRMLADEETQLEKKEMLELSCQSAKEFLDLLNDIIDFSRFQAENTGILAKKFDLRSLLEKAVTMQRAAAVAKGLELLWFYPDDLPSVFISDPYRLRRIILNLLSNAIRFTTQGQVSISVKLAKTIDPKNLVVQLIVIDTGIGIPPEKQSLIFEKFYRVSPANQNKYLGAGLGLPLIKQLMTDLEGEIELRSSPETGTIFVCSIPLKRPLTDEILDNTDN